MKSFAQFLIVSILSSILLYPFFKAKKEHEIAQEKIQEEKKKNQEEIDKLISQAALIMRSDIANHRVGRGMTDQEVIQSIGEPDEKSSTIHENVRTERWVYSTNVKGTLIFQETSDKPGLKCMRLEN
jgi:hypothetical protein